MRNVGLNLIGVSPDMARVSLIVLKTPEIDWPSESVAAYRAGLEDTGVSVEVLAVSAPTQESRSTAGETWCRSIVAEGPDLAELAVAGIRASRGQILVILDLAMSYKPEDLSAVVAALEEEEVVVAIACRPSSRLGGLSARLFRTTDSTSGLIGLKRPQAVDSLETSLPGGSRFALEFLTRVHGSRVEVPVGAVASPSRRLTLIGDLRLLKRLADDRLGNLSRLIQFCFVGASGMVIDLTLYEIIKSILAKTSVASMSVPIVGGSAALAVAAVLAIAPALTWNFSINRRLTFNDSRHGSILRQYFRYVLSNLLGIGVNLSLRLILPARIGFFKAHELTAAVVGIVAATGISFSMARWFVFGQKSVPTSDRSAGAKNRRSSSLHSKVTARSEHVQHTECTGMAASTGALNDQISA